MFLKQISYIEYDNLPNEWVLEEWSLEQINLLVGKNATGKTRTINIIAGLGNVLSGFQSQMFDTGTYLAEFYDSKDEQHFRYNLSFKNKKIEFEKLYINDKRVLDRENDGSCKIYASKEGKDLEIKVPQNLIVAITRRDEIQHPYLEKLFQWALGVRHYQFSTPLGRENGLVINDLDNINVNIRDTNQVTSMFLNGKKRFGKEFLDLIIKNMSFIGYEISDIGVSTNPNLSILSPFGGPIYFLNVKETDRSAVTYQTEMSQGMFRVLSLIIQIIYSEKTLKPSTLLIDDIGEGLDYDRATKIIGFLSENVDNNNIQIIMATNDRFVMNAVDLKYWQVIQRNDNHCKIFNNKNSADIFNDFVYTGLSNFDFLSTKFYEKGLEEK